MWPGDTSSQRSMASTGVTWVEVTASLESTDDASITETTTQTTTRTDPCYPWDFPICDPFMLATFYFTNYATSIALATGIPGNMVTGFILARMRPFNSSAVWLLTLTLTDLFSLCMRLVYSQAELYAGRYLATWSCQFLFIMADFCEHTSYMYLVGLTVERLIAVWFPLRMVTWCNRRRAGISIAVIQVLCLCSNLHYVETMRYNGEYCTIKLKYQSFWQYIYKNQIQNSLHWCLPCLSLIVLNVLIVSRLKNSRKFQKQMQDQQVKGRDKNQRQINRMLAAASIWFIVCVILEIVFNYTEGLWGPRLPRDPLSDRARQITMNVSGVLRMYNHSANFVLYVIAARKFRSEVIRLVTCNIYVGIGKRAAITTTTKGSSH